MALEKDGELGPKKLILMRRSSSKADRSDIMSGYGNSNR